MSSEQNRLASFGQAEDRLAHHYSNAGQQGFVFRRQQARCTRRRYQIWAVAGCEPQLLVSAPARYVDVVAG